MSAPIVSVEAETKVQETADDAAVSKLSTVRQGYVNDPFMALFVRKSLRRSPLINRGYFARISAIELMLRRFVSICHRNKESRCQIVSLGAGFDTSFFKLWATDSSPTMYYEVDFPEVTSRKAAIIKKHKVLQDCIQGHAVMYPDGGESFSSGSESPRKSELRHDIHAHSSAPDSTSIPGITFKPNKLGGCDVEGAAYRLLTADLRDVAALQAVLTAAKIDTTAPTLFLSECVLVYLEPEQSCAIIAWAAHSFRKSVFVTYEQIRPHDAFGQIMARNLEDRGYTLRGLHTFPDIPAQIARYKELGYAACTVVDMNDVYYRLLARSEVGRVERLELFDEVEEWHLMSAHYCIAVAVNDTHGKPAEASGAKGKGHKEEMAAPAPKKPRTMDPPMSPTEIANEVVHSHEAAHQRMVEAGSSPLLRARGRSMSGSSGTVGLQAVTSALSFASGTQVESVELTPRETPLSSPSSSSGIERIHTHAGEVVLGGAHVDFEAIAEAEQEMMHARHTREAVGVDALREGSDKHVKGVRIHESPDAPYDSDPHPSGASGAQQISLFDMLFPVEEWNKAQPSLKTHGSGKFMS